MEKVYVITAGEYSDYHVVKIFSTYEKAQEYIDIMSALDYEDLNVIEEWELDDFNVSRLYVQYCYIHSTGTDDVVKVWGNNDTTMSPDNLITNPSGYYYFIFSLPYSKRLVNASNKNELLLKIARDRFAEYKAKQLEF